MFKKNTAVSGFGIGNFINATTGATVVAGVPTCKRTLDGTAGACANAAAYDAAGLEWKIDLAAGDLNGDVVALSFTLTDCLPINYTIRTSTTLVSDVATTLGAAGAGLTALGDTRLANLDAAVSTRSTYAGGAVASVTGDVGGKVLGGGVSEITGVGVWSDLRNILGTLLTETTPGWIVAAFKKFFNIETPLLTTATAMRGTDGAYTGTPPTADEITDKLWDEVLHVDHEVAGSAAVLLQSAGAAADPLLNLVPGPYADGTAGNALGSIPGIKAATDAMVTGLPTTVIYPVAEDGTVLLEAGDDYQTAEGYQLDWLDSGEAWPTLTSATITFTIGTTLTKAGSVVVGSGTGKKVRVVLTAAETATLTQGQVYWYNVKATLTNGHVITLVRRSRLQVGKSLS